MKWPLRVPIDVQLSFFCSIQGVLIFFYFVN